MTYHQPEPHRRIARAKHAGEHPQEHPSVRPEPHWDYPPSQRPDLWEQRRRKAWTLGFPPRRAAEHGQSCECMICDEHHWHQQEHRTAPPVVEPAIEDVPTQRFPQSPVPLSAKANRQTWKPAYQFPESGVWVLTRVTHSRYSEPFWWQCKADGCHVEHFPNPATWHPPFDTLTIEYRMDDKFHTVYLHACSKLCADMIESTRRHHAQEEARAVAYRYFMQRIEDSARRWEERQH